MSGPAPASYRSGIAGALHLDPVIPVVRQILLSDVLSDVDFGRPFKMFRDVVDSGPLFNVTLVSLKNAVGDLYGRASNVDFGLSRRLRYLETAVTSTAASVYNLVLSLVFGVASLVTLGQDQGTVDQMHKHWTHTVLSVTALGVSCMGTISPELGMKANVTCFVNGLPILFQSMHEDLVGKIGRVYQRHSRSLKEAIAQACDSSGINYGREFTPFFDYLDANLVRVKTFSEFAEVVQNAATRFPHVRFTLSPERVFT